MRHRQCLCIISIFLCATFSAKAQALQAVEYERVLFRGASPAVANAALLGRAECLVGIGRYKDAVDALERVRMFALRPEEMLEKNYLQGLSLYRLGEYEGAAVCLDEGFPESRDAKKLSVLILSGVRRTDEALAVAGEAFPERFDDIRALLRKLPGIKKEGTATMLALLPPLGHLYLGEKDWPAVSAMSYLGAALSVWQIVEGNYITGILGGGMILNASYMENNIAQMAARTQKTNERNMAEFLSSLEALMSK